MAPQKKADEKQEGFPGVSSKKSVAPGAGLPGEGGSHREPVSSTPSRPRPSQGTAQRMPNPGPLQAPETRTRTRRCLAPGSRGRPWRLRSPNCGEAVVHGDQQPVGEATAHVRPDAQAPHAAPGIRGPLRAARTASAACAW